MNVVVLGGTGHIGGAIARELCRLGHTVIAPCRNPEPLADTAVTAVRVSSYDHLDIAALLNGADWLVDAAAPYPLELGTPAALLRGAERKLAARLSTARALGTGVIYVSSFVTLLRRPRYHPYYLLKQRLEQIVLRERRAGLRSIIVNPPACFGPYDGKGSDLAMLPALASGRVAALLSGTLPWVDVRDLAADLAAAMESGRSLGPARIHSRTTSTATLAANVSHLTGTPPPLIVPSLRGVASLGATFGETACQLAGLHPPVPALAVLLLLDANEPLGGELLPAATRRRDLDTTLRDALAWYRRSLPATPRTAHGQ